MDHRIAGHGAGQPVGVADLRLFKSRDRSVLAAGRLPRTAIPAVGRFHRAVQSERSGTLHFFPDFVRRARDADVERLLRRPPGQVGGHRPWSAAGDGSWTSKHSLDSLLDYKQKYASNPIIDLLREKPQEHRVAGELAPLTRSYLVNDRGQNFAALYGYEWLQHLFQYYRVQSLDVIQMPRQPEFDSAYLANFSPLKPSDRGLALDESRLQLCARL